jgi:hypothetical protein
MPYTLNVDRSHVLLHFLLRLAVHDERDGGAKSSSSVIQFLRRTTKIVQDIKLTFVSGGTRPVRNDRSELSQAMRRKRQRRSSGSKEFCTAESAHCRIAIAASNPDLPVLSFFMQWYNPVISDQLR